MKSFRRLRIRPPLALYGGIVKFQKVFCRLSKALRGISNERYQ